jgi:hypothetical protein
VLLGLHLLLLVHHQDAILSLQALLESACSEAGLLGGAGGRQQRAAGLAKLGSLTPMMILMRWE